MSSPLYMLNMLRVSVERPTRKWNQLKKGQYLLSPFTFVIGFLFGCVVCPLAEGLLRYLCQVWLVVSKKIEKPIKPREPEKNNRKNQTVKKNWLEFLKNLTEPKPKKNQAKPEKTEPNQKKPSRSVWTDFFPKITKSKLVWTGFGLFFQKLNWF